VLDKRSLSRGVGLALRSLSLALHALVGAPPTAVHLTAMNSQNSLLGTPSGRFLVIDHSDDSTLGRWDSYADAEAHVGEHVAMDPEADLEIHDLAVTPC